MGTADKSSSRWIYVFLRDKHVQILRVFILLCGFAALGLVLFGRDVWAISLVVAVGTAFLYHYKDQPLKFHSARNQGCLFGSGTATAYSHERYPTRLHGSFAGTAVRSDLLRGACKKAGIRP